MWSGIWFTTPRRQAAPLGRVVGDVRQQQHGDRQLVTRRLRKHITKSITIAPSPLTSMVPADFNKR